MSVQTGLQDLSGFKPSNPLGFGPRICRPQGVVVARHHVYKLYVILSDIHTIEDCPRAAVLQDIALQAFEGWDLANDHPTGFAILHLARDGTYLLASRWNNANNLRHRVYNVDIDADIGKTPLVSALRPLDDPWTIACVWELRLIKREVDAWISAVLARNASVLTADMIEDYAAIQFEGEL